MLIFVLMVTIAYPVQMIKLHDTREALASSGNLTKRYYGRQIYEYLKVLKPVRQNDM